MRPCALDLFCGAGGASMGLYRAGFDVVGIDIRRQPRYPFRFIRADALRPPVRLEDFDLIWASPPCQAYSVVRAQTSRKMLSRLIEPVQEMLVGSGRMFVIENVLGAPIDADLVLCGADFDLDVVRYRKFEIRGFAPPFLLNREHLRRVSTGDLACVTGNGANNPHRYRGGPKWTELPFSLREALGRRNSVAGWSEAMGIYWMGRKELAEAIPPAYAEFIGRAALKHLERAA